MILIACFHANLLVAKLVKRTVGDLRNKAALEVFRESRGRLIAELTSAAEIIHANGVVEAHIKLLNLQHSIGVWDVSLW
jgi:hypothetical protein